MLGALAPTVERLARCQGSNTSDFNGRFLPWTAAFWKNLVTMEPAKEDRRTDVLSYMSYAINADPMELPSTCDISQGGCSFQYGKLQSLLGSKPISIQLSMEQCPDNLHGLPSIEVTCAGEGKFPSTHSTLSPVQTPPGPAT